MTSRGPVVATVAEVDEYFAPYAPFRGWAGLFMLVAHSRRAGDGPPLRYHPPRPESLIYGIVQLQQKIARSRA